MVAIALLSACAGPGQGEGASDDVAIPNTVTQLSTSTSTTSTSETTPSTSETTGSTTTTEEAVPDCVLRAVPASAGLDPFYTQGCQVDGFWIVANDVVEPAAITAAADMVAHIFAADERLAPVLTANTIRLGIIGRDQRTTEMPEYRDLNQAFPETDWDSRARGLGATSERPLVSAGEENVLCLPTDRYLGEDILLHEFAHVLHEFGYQILDADFEDELRTAYNQAVINGTWANTYSATNHLEYWAEGVQSYFGRNIDADPADGIHGPIDTQAELQLADPALFDLIDQRLKAAQLSPRCR